MSNFLVLSTDDPKSSYVLPIKSNGQAVQVGHRPKTVIPVAALHPSWRSVVDATSDGLTWSLEDEASDMDILVEEQIEEAKPADDTANLPVDLGVEIESGTTEDDSGELADESDESDAETEVPTADEIWGTKAGPLRSLAETYRVGYTSARETRQALVTKLHGGDSDESE